ncbi:hypothetical protein BC941DRAFT_484827 [Chlamydoabsidia padenii]|nr:hypothetical protein BC941DRAFT_484827 [Chlamydoabsidia padenii]
MKIAEYESHLNKNLDFPIDMSGMQLPLVVNIPLVSSNQLPLQSAPVGFFSRLWSGMGSIYNNIFGSKTPSNGIDIDLKDRIPNPDFFWPLPINNDTNKENTDPTKPSDHQIRTNNHSSDKQSDNETIPISKQWLCDCTNNDSGANKRKNANEHNAFASNKQSNNETIPISKQWLCDCTNNDSGTNKRKNANEQDAFASNKRRHVDRITQNTSNNNKRKTEDGLDNGGTNKRHCTENSNTRTIHNNSKRKSLGDGEQSGCGTSKRRRRSV